MYAQRNEACIGKGCTVECWDTTSQKVEKTIEGPFKIQRGQRFLLDSRETVTVSNILRHPDNGETFVQFYGGKEIVIVEQ